MATSDVKMKAKTRVVDTGSKTYAVLQEDVMVQAYILVQTEVGKAADVARQIAEIAGVMTAEDVTGPYDVIVRASAENVDELGKLVAAQIQAVDGITRTLTCPVVRI
jgi:DNA-binding Lrp family transcriptional regulator